MKRFAKALSLAFSGGCLGALVNSLIVWGFGDFGITGAFGVKIAPALTKAWIYPRLVWGGIWGILLLFPVIKHSHAVRGLVLSILPTWITWFVIFPSKGKGMMGFNLGALAPVFPLFFNAIWGLVAGAWFALGYERYRSSIR